MRPRSAAVALKLLQVTKLEFNTSSSSTFTDIYSSLYICCLSFFGCQHSRCDTIIAVCNIEVFHKKWNPMLYFDTIRYATIRYKDVTLANLDSYLKRFRRKVLMFYNLLKQFYNLLKLYKSLIRSHLEHLSRPSHASIMIT